MSATGCSIPGCDRSCRSSGMCQRHYDLRRRRGSATAAPLARPTVPFWDNVQKTDGCWLWVGYRCRQGYGRTSSKKLGDATLAHRIAYEQLVGPIPEGLQLDHTCHTRACRRGSACPHRACCNPAHLDPATPKANTLRSTNFSADNARKTHCPRGHEYTPANTKRTKSHPTWRECKTCHRDRERARKPQKTGVAA